MSKEGTDSPPAESPKNPHAKEKAKTALETRSKKSSDAIYYWLVLGGFVIACLACVVYLIREWRESANLVAAIDLAKIDEHNKKDTPFKRGANELFAVIFPNIIEYDFR